MESTIVTEKKSPDTLRFERRKARIPDPLYFGCPCCWLSYINNPESSDEESPSSEDE